MCFFQSEAATDERKEYSEAEREQHESQYDTVVSWGLPHLFLCSHSGFSALQLIVLSGLKPQVQPNMINFHSPHKIVYFAFATILFSYIYVHPYFFILFFFLTGMI